MRVKKAIKKLVALGAGAFMVGATIFGAMAATYDLSMYPAPFVKEGAFNAMIVVGEAAATNDVLGAIDIATNLQFAAKVVKEINVGGAGISLGGESYKISKSSNKLEMNESLSSIQSAVTGSDLKKTLTDGKINNEFGDFTYTQTIYTPANGKVLYTTDSDDSKSLAKPYLVIPNADTVYKYKISFTPALKSDHNTDVNRLEDIESKKLKLFGKEYTILSAKHPAGNQTTLTLMAGAIADILEEGASKTYTLAGKDYDVTVDFVGSSTTKLTVNDQTTTTLNKGDTFTLSDGVQLGVVDILSQQFSGGTRKVEFNLGASKIKLDDTTTSSSTNWDGVVTIGNTDLSNVKARIVTALDGGVVNGADITISTIELNYTAGSTIYAAPGDSVSKRADTREAQKGTFFAGGFDFRYEGSELPRTEKIDVVPSGSQNYKIKWTNLAGVAYDSDILTKTDTTTNSGSYEFGRTSGSTVYQLVTNESETVGDEEMFVVSKSKNSRIYQFKDIQPGSSTTDNTGIIKLRDLGSKETIDVTYSNLQGSLNVDGNTFLINVSSDTSSSNLSGVDLDGDGSVRYNESGSFVLPELWTQYGLLIQLQANRTQGGGESQVTFVTERVESSSTNDSVTIGMADSGDGKLDISNNLVSYASATNTQGAGYTPALALQLEEDSTYKYGIYGVYGMYIQIDQKGSGNTQNDFRVVYPDDQVFGAFFVTGEVAPEVTKSSGGKVLSTTVTKIDVGAAVLDSDPAVAGQETKKNLIVVGGPAANRAAAVLLGKPFPSYGADSGIPENAALVKLVEQTDGKVALIVAGWNAEDTQRASRVVAQYEKYLKDQTGKTEVQVTGTSLSDIKVSGPVAKVSAPVAK